MIYLSIVGHILFIIDNKLFLDIFKLSTINLNLFQKYSNKKMEQNTINKNDIIKNKNDFPYIFRINNNLWI